MSNENEEALPPLPDYVERVLLDYADACFRCGEYPGDDAARYRALSDHRERMWQSVVQTIGAVLAQRQQVPNAVTALLRIASRLENMGRPQAANGVRLAVLELEKDAALTAAPQAAEPVAEKSKPCGQCRKADSWGIPLSKACIYDCKFEPLNTTQAAQAQPQERQAKEHVCGAQGFGAIGDVCPGCDAQPQEPPRSAPLAEDPHREHWFAIAKAAEAIGASPNCGPEQAAEFCRAIDRLSAALTREEDK